MARRIRDEATDDWGDTGGRGQVHRQGRHVLRGRARLIAPGVVDVEGVRHRARRGGVVATGSRPAVSWGRDRTPPLLLWTDLDLPAAPAL